MDKKFSTTIYLFSEICRFGRKKQGRRARNDMTSSKNEIKNVKLKTTIIICIQFANCEYFSISFLSF